MTGEEREARVTGWVRLGLSSRAARLLVNEGIDDVATLMSGRWLMIRRCGRKMRWEVMRLLVAQEGKAEERRI